MKDEMSYAEGRIDGVRNALEIYNESSDLVEFGSMADKYLTELKKEFIKLRRENEGSNENNRKKVEANF